MPLPAFVQRSAGMKRMSTRSRTTPNAASAADGNMRARSGSVTAAATCGASVGGQEVVEGEVAAHGDHQEHDVGKRPAREAQERQGSGAEEQQREAGGEELAQGGVEQLSRNPP